MRGGSNNISKPPQWGAPRGLAANYLEKMSLDSSSLFSLGLGACALIGGPWFLIASSVKRRKEKSVSVDRNMNADIYGEQLMTELGPLREDELRSVYRLLCNFVARDGGMDLDRLRWSVRRAREAALERVVEDPSLNET